MAESRTYSLGSATLEQLGHSVESFLRTQDGMEVEGIQGSDGYLVQARQRSGSWKKYAGLDKAIQVRLVPGDSGLVMVTVGEGKWIDKLGVGIAGLWFAPLLFVAGFGALTQLKLADDVLRHIGAFLAVNGGMAK